MLRRRVSFHTLGCKLNFSESSTLARQFAETLGIAVQIEEESWGRNLVMDTTKLERFGIRFDTTHQGIQRCFKDYGLRTL